MSTISLLHFPDPHPSRSNDNMKPILVSAIILGATAAAILVPTPPAGAEPQLLGWDASELANARRQSKAGNPVALSAWKQLQREAEEALELTPPSVMTKSQVAPSGDKHDYRSFGPYWWPDSTKENGLPYIRRDGEVNPESRGETSDWRSLRMMTDAVTTLSLAYYFSGEDRYAAKAAELLRVWFLDPETRMNPHLRYGQAIPGRTQGRGIGIIETRQLLKLVEAVGLLAQSNHWPKEDDRRLRDWFQDYLDWILTSGHGRDEDRTRNNHATWYDAQVVAFAWFTGQEELARERLKQVAARRIDTQIDADGRQPHELARSRSFDYSTMNARGFLTLATYGKRLGVALWRHKGTKGQSIPSAVHYLARYADPELEWKFKQITSVDRAQKLRPLLAHAAATFDCRQSAAALRELNEQAETPPLARLLWPSAWDWAWE